MRFPLLASWIALGLLTVPTVGCFNRPNPRISEITRKDTAGTVTQTFAYDDGGRVTEVAKEEDGTAETIELEWEGDVLVKITVSRDFQGFATTQEIELEYEGGRLVAAEGSDGDTEESTTVTYDDAGRLAELETDSTFGNGGTSSSRDVFDYDDAGVLVERASTFTFQQGDSESTSESSLELDVADGHVTGLAFSAGGEDRGEAAVEYDDQNRIETVVTELPGFGPGGEPILEEQTSTFEYDDAGRIAAVTREGGGTDEIEIEYEDGDASGLDVTPADVLFIGLWDLKGQGYTTFDVRTQVARFVGASW